MPIVGLAITGDELPSDVRFFGQEIRSLIECASSRREGCDQTCSGQALATLFLYMAHMIRRAYSSVSDTLCERLYLVILCYYEACSALISFVEQRPRSKPVGDSLSPFTASSTRHSAGACGEVTARS
jgi:hypothetical protein